MYELKFFSKDQFQCAKLYFSELNIGGQIKDEEIRILSNEIQEVQEELMINIGSVLKSDPECYSNALETIKWAEDTINYYNAAIEEERAVEALDESFISQADIQVQEKTLIKAEAKVVIKELMDHLNPIDIKIMLCLKLKGSSDVHKLHTYSQSTIDEALTFTFGEKIEFSSDDEIIEVAVTKAADIVVHDEGTNNLSDNEAEDLLLKLNLYLDLQNEGGEEERIIEVIGGIESYNQTLHWLNNSQ